MSDQTDVFIKAPVDPQVEENKNEVAPSSKIDLFVDKLMAIKREDGSPKYDSVEKALDALVESQAFIPRLQEENGLLRNQLDEASKKILEATTLDTVLERIKPVTQEELGATPPSSELAQDTATLDAQIEAAIKRRDAQTAAIDNVKHVDATLRAKYGDRASDVVSAKAAELGISNDDFKLLAAKSPKLVLGHFDIKPTSASPTTSTLNPHSFEAPKEKLGRPEKSILSGSSANDSNRTAFWNKIKAEVNEKYGITE